MKNDLKVFQFNNRITFEVILNVQNQRFADSNLKLENSISSLNFWNNFKQSVNTRMCFALGASELRSDNQGRSRVTSFSQETGYLVQYKSRIDFKPNLLCIVQDAQKFLAHFASFFFFISKIVNTKSYYYFHRRFV